MGMISSLGIVQWDELALLAVRDSSKAFVVWPSPLVACVCLHEDIRCRQSCHSMIGIKYPHCQLEGGPGRWGSLLLGEN